MSIAVSIRIPDGLAKRLDGVAKETERPKSYIIQKALESYFDDSAELQIAMDRLRDNTDKKITSQEMREGLGI